MRKYAEIKSIDGRRVLIKIDSIRMAEEVPGVSETIIDGSKFAAPYEWVRWLIEFDDSRVVIDYTWPPALLWLARNRIINYTAEFGPELTLQFLRELVICDSDSECREVFERYKSMSDHGGSELPTP